MKTNGWSPISLIQCSFPESNKLHLTLPKPIKHNPTFSLSPTNLTQHSFPDSNKLDQTLLKFNWPNSMFF